MNWDGVKKTVNRAKHEVLVKFGKTEETVDIQFNQEKERFSGHRKHMKKLNKDMQKALDLYRQLAVSLSTLSEDIVALYDSNCQLFSAAVQLQYSIQELDNARIAYEEQIRDDWQGPMSEYLGYFSEIKTRIGERERRRVDMDRYRAEVKDRTEKGGKDPAKLAAAKEKLHNMTEAYQYLNGELLKDIPLLVNDRTVFFDPLLATTADSLIVYYQRCAKTMTECTPYIASVDRSACHRHPMVITDKEFSATYRQIILPDHAPPEAQAAQGQAGQAGQAQPRQQGYGAPPQQGYGAPPAQPGYGAPPAQPGYGAPPAQPGYGAPPAQPGYGAPPAQPGYGAPPAQPGYGAPPAQPGYGAPPAQAGFGAPPVARPQPSRPTPTTPTGIRARALYPFAGQDQTELSFNANDTLIIHKKEGDWWEAELNGKRGLIPGNYVQLI